MNNNLPYVEASFSISGQFDIEHLSEKIGIFPCKKRGLDDWPDAIKNNPDLPEHLRPCCEWSISREESKCISIEKPVCNIISQLAGKEETIIHLCKEKGLKTCLCIVIHGEAMMLPELALSAEIVSYFGCLKTKIGFDLYVYE